MTKLFRWISLAFVALLVLAGVTFGLVYYLAAQSLPDYDARYTRPEIGDRLEIIRDSHAIPHILGSSDTDVLFGLGFAHAQDRLWQMEIMRRTAQGRLAELFGEDAVASDLLMRALDIYAISQRAVAQQTPETLRLLTAYSAGVNAWVDTVRQQALGRGAPEFFLYSNAIAPWSPADSIALVKLMALRATDKAAMEVLRAKLSFRIPPERIADILPNAPGLETEALQEFSSLFPEITPAPLSGAPAASFSPVAPVGLAGASNAWAAAGGRSAGGGTLLATDPHVALSAPGLYMLARLELQSGGVIGATIPGIPAVLVGRSDGFGWGVTASYLDDQDLYLERLNPQNEAEYLTEDGAVPFETKPTVIAVADGPDITRTLYRTRNGPVIPAAGFGVDALRTEGHVISLAWTGMAEGDQSIKALLDLMQAQSVAEGRAALAPLVAPSMNYILADRTDIAIVTAGRIPMRDPAHQTQGRIPSQGWLDVNLWQGFLPYAQNPYTENPPSGIVVNTNNAITDAAFPEHFSFDWGDTQRIQRATNLLNDRQFHTRDSFVAIQTDTVSISARFLLPLMGQNLWFADQGAEPGSHTARRREALDLLSNWNGEMGQHSPEPLIYAAWVKALQGRLIWDDLGQLSGEMTRINPLFIERVFRNVDGAAIWCDVKTTAEIEDCQTIASLALDEALQQLVAKYGKDINRWRWGTAHLAFHENQVLGQLPVLGWFADLWQETSGGDNTLMRGQTRSYGDSPFTNINAAGFRAVYDFDNPSNSVFIIATGQSGHLLSKHYDDLSVLWRRGEYLPMTLDIDLARGGAVGITVLEPATTP